MVHITLSGSMLFQDHMHAIAVQLESWGFTAKAPISTAVEQDNGFNHFMEYITSRGGVEHVSADDPAWKIKGDSIRDYLVYIDQADALLVCNFDKGTDKNRIGANSFLEMGYAFFNNIPIFVLNEPPYQDAKIEEIMGMQPTFLARNIARLKDLLSR